MKNERALNLEYLRILAIFHYILGALIALFSCLPGGYLALGIAFLSGAMNGNNGSNPPQELGWIFVAMGGIGVTVSISIAVLLVLGGNRLRKRRSHTFCLVVAGIICLMMPLGTLLGVFSLIVLLRPGVKEEFSGIIIDAPRSTRDYE